MIGISGRDTWYVFCLGGVPMDKINKLKEMIADSNKIVFFGGAGVSTESGIPDFRSKGGLYNQVYKFPPEYMLSHSCFESMPDEFYRFYKDKILLKGILPNKGHFALAKLEEQGKLSCVVTQNIDHLHEMAGSKMVYHLHGTIMTNHCPTCGSVYSLEELEQKLELSMVPKCDKCGGIIKPDVTLYEEMLPDDAWNSSMVAVGDADMLIICGTSLTVYPAAYIVEYFKGKYLVIINRDATPKDDKAHLVIHESFGEVMARVVE